MPEIIYAAIAFMLFFWIVGLVRSIRPGGKGIKFFFYQLFYCGLAIGIICLFTLYPNSGCKPFLCNLNGALWFIGLGSATFCIWGIYVSIAATHKALDQHKNKNLEDILD